LLDGAPLPYAEDFGPDCDDPCVIIPVELVRGPIMFVSAGYDEIWPSASMARAMSERLVKHGDAAGHELLEYADASHSLGYLRPSLPAGLMLGDLNDTAQIELVRGHLRQVTAAFSAGDFSVPAAIHGIDMPGLAALSVGASRLRIVYDDVPSGGHITYGSSDPALVVALHDWFAAQNNDHNMGH
jgi:hypothetical protein